MQRTQLVLTAKSQPATAAPRFRPAEGIGDCGKPRFPMSFEAFRQSAEEAGAIPEVHAVTQRVQCRFGLMALPQCRQIEKAVSARAAGATASSKAAARKQVFRIVLRPS
jgi:hypothetical protein